MTETTTSWTCHGCRNSFPDFGVDRPEFHDRHGHLFCCGLCTGKYGTRRARIVWRFRQRNTPLWRTARRIAWAVTPR